MKKPLSLQRLRYQIVDAPNVEGAHQLISAQLKKHNIAQIGAYDKKKFCFLVYDSDALVAGLYAYLSLGNFYIDILWVDEKHRGMGIGTQLLAGAETHAIDNDALYIRVNTGSFQAPAFYHKNGYQQFAKFPITVPNKTEQFDYYFIKHLTKKA